MGVRRIFSRDGQIRGSEEFRGVPEQSPEADEYFENSAYIIRLLSVLLSLLIH